MKILKTSKGRLDAADEAAFSDLQTELAANPARLLLHLHGGLVEEGKGVAIAQALGGFPPLGYALDDWQRVAVVWRTGFFETLENQWPKLFSDDRLYKVILKRVLGYAASKLGLPEATGRSASDGLGLSPTEIARRLEARLDHDPFEDVDVALELGVPGGRGPILAEDSDGALIREFQLWVRDDPELHAVAEDIAAWRTYDEPSGRSAVANGDRDRGRIAFSNLSEAARREIDANVAKVKTEGPAGRGLLGVDVALTLIKHAALIAMRVIKRFRRRRDHGFYATVVEELVRELYGDLIGAAVWRLMKENADQHFAPGGAGRRLVDLIAAHPPEILAIVGHSAGSIWASAFLDALSGLDNPPRIRLAFMAPAVRMDRFADTLAKASGLIENFRLITMRDDLERKDPVLGKSLAYLYPSSLLYLISGVLENRDAEAFADAPLLGMQRFLTSDPAWLKTPADIASVNSVVAFLGRQSSAPVFSTIAGGEGLSSDAVSHGGFDQDPATIASVSHFARR